MLRSCYNTYMVDEANGAKGELVVVSEALAKRGAVAQLARGIFDRFVDPASVVASKDSFSDGVLAGGVAEKGAEQYGVRLKIPNNSQTIEVTLFNSLAEAFNPNSAAVISHRVYLKMEADKNGRVLIEATMPKALRLDTAFGA